MAQNKSKAWTPEEDDRLRVAAKLKRTMSAIKTRAGTLKIAIKRKPRLKAAK
jgi:hypothetical protein